MITFLLKNFSIYFLFSSLTAVLPIVLMPVLTRYMTPEDYGLYSIYAMIVMLVGVFFRFELNQALKREFVSDSDEFGFYFGTAFVFSLFLLIPFYVFVLLMSFFFDNALGIDFSWFFLIVPLVFFKAQILNLHHLWQISSRSLFYGLWGFFSNLFMYLVVIVLLVFFDLGWVSRVYGDWFVCFISFGVAVFFLKKHFGFYVFFERRYLKKMLGFSLPLIPGAIISYIMIASDRFFIAELASSHDLGLYSIALQFSFSLVIVFSAIFPVWESYIYNKIKYVDIDSFKRLLLVLIGVSFVGGVCVYVLVYLISRVMPFLVDASFLGADLYLLPCLCAALSAGIYRLTHVVLVFMRKTKEVLFVGLLIACVNMVMMYFFVSSLGAVGAGYALAFSFCLGGLVNMLTVYGYRTTAVSDA